LGKPGEVTLVAVAAGARGAPAVPVGWAWLSGRTNSLIGARYGNFRSLVTADIPGRSQVAELLMLAELGERGILHALASKNPPEAAAHTARVTGWRFAAAECGWDRKSDALARIAATLGIGVDALAFVDDDPFE